MAYKKLALFIVEVHTVTLAIAPERAIGTFSAAGPRSIAKGQEAVVPHIHKMVGIDGTLMKIGPNAGACRDGSIGQHRSHTDAGVAGIKMVAHFVLVVTQKTLAAITEANAVLPTGIADKLKYAGKLFVGKLKFGMPGSPAHGEDCKNAPVLYPCFDQKIAQGFEVVEVAFVDAGNHIPHNVAFAGQHMQGIQHTGIAARIVAQPVVRLAEAIETEGNGMQTGSQQRIESAATERHSVGNQAPGKTTAVQFATAVLQVAPEQCLATGKNDHRTVGVHMGCNFVDHPHKIGHRHIGLRSHRPAIASAVATRKIAAQGTFPKQRIEFMLPGFVPAKGAVNFKSRQFTQGRKFPDATIHPAVFPD